MRRSFSYLWGVSINLILTLILELNPAIAQPVSPTHQIRLVVGFGSGTPPDIAARIIAEKLANLRGVPVIVENIVGASGNLAGAQVAGAAPDGHTLLLIPNSGILINPSLFPRMPFNPLKDIVPVSIIYSYPNVLIVNKELGVENVQQLVALARANPAKLSYGSAGTGTTMHLAGEILKAVARINIQHIPYRGGTNLFVDLMTSRIHFSFVPTTSTLEQVRNGAVNVLAVTSATRFSLLPDVPTMQEVGFPGFDINVWWGVVAPAKTPPEIVAKLQRDLKAVVTLPDVQSKFSAIGVAPVGSTAEEFATLIEEEAPKWKNMIKNLNLTVD